MWSKIELIYEKMSRRIANNDSNNNLNNSINRQIASNSLATNSQSNNAIMNGWPQWMPNMIYNSNATQQSLHSTQTPYYIRNICHNKI